MRSRYTAWAVLVVLGVAYADPPTDLRSQASPPSSVAHHEAVGAASLDLFVANGVVGTRDMGAQVDFVIPLRDRINRGELLGPEIVAAGPILDSTGRLAVSPSHHGRERRGRGRAGLEPARRRFRQGARPDPA